MKRTETLFIGIILFVAIITTATALWYTNLSSNNSDSQIEYTTKYGDFLATQHAIYVNDFDTASVLINNIPDGDLSVIKNARLLVNFLNGQSPDEKTAQQLKSEKSIPSQLIYDTYLLTSGDNWAEIYKRHQRDESTLSAPLRIWSGVAVGKTADAIKFINKLSTNDSWKSFIRGQIHAETNNPDLAATEFAKVSIDFMNINDYQYLIAFYNHHNMTDPAEKLRSDFTERPGGMFMLDYTNTPKWDDFSGNNYRSALSFSLIQTISHTPIMMYSDLSLLLLRCAQLVNNNGAMDAIYYYIGQYFYNNGGDYERHFAQINKASPFYPFSLMKTAEKTNTIKDLSNAVKANPLFVPAVNKLVAKNIQSGNKSDALRIVNRALKNPNLTEGGRAYFLKTRAQVHLIFGDTANAQKDVKSASDVLPVDAGILAIQSRIWSKNGQDLESAYEYAMALVRKNPTDIESWDVLGIAILANDGAAAALDVVERVGQVADSCSILFEHLGDLYIILGNEKLAQDAYQRAINLSDDGLTVVPVLEKKLRKIK